MSSLIKIDDKKIFKGKCSLREVSDINIDQDDYINWKNNSNLIVLNETTTLYGLPFLILEKSIKDEESGEEIVKKYMIYNQIISDMISPILYYFNEEFKDKSINDIELDLDKIVSKAKKDKKEWMKYFASQYEEFLKQANSKINDRKAN